MAIPDYQSLMLPLLNFFQTNKNIKSEKSLINYLMNLSYLKRKEKNYYPQGNNKL